ncbi:MAG TPA: alpha/beta fold hydrolase, partial [Bacillota bacterium]|nr:alpha/beta fold hydrolase [Bacillota bacterium]
MNNVFADYMAWWQQESVKNVARTQRLQKMLLHDPEPRVGLTPKEIIWTRNKAKLYHFHNDKVKYSTPILMIYALINRPYIMDLHPGNSMVEYLVNQGFDVYMLDWGSPGDEDKHLNFSHFVLDYLPDVYKRVQQQSGSDRVSLIGYCMGGTLTSIFAALNPDINIANIIFLASPIDFENAGKYTTWLDAEYFNVDKMVDTLGNIPSQVIDFGNKMLKPVTNFYSSYKGLWENMDNEAVVENWRYMNHWVSDGTDFPGEAFRQWIKEFYQKNALVRKELFLRGRQVDLANITCPVLNL